MAIRTSRPTAPPTPAPIPTVLLLLEPDACPVSDGVATGALVDTNTEIVEAVAVGPDVFVARLDAEDEVDVVVALVLAPTTAPCSVNTAFVVLQHLCLSASLSQQYFASSPYP